MKARTPGTASVPGPGLGYLVTSFGYWCRASMYNRLCVSCRSASIDIAHTADGVGTCFEAEYPARFTFTTIQHRGPAVEEVELGGAVEVAL